MKERSNLSNGAEITIYYGEEGKRKPQTFHIVRLISNRGASTIAYRAYHENSSNIGVLREFFPLEDDIVLDRNPEGVIKLDMDPDSEAERSDFLISKRHYLEPLYILQKLRRAKEDDSLAFIPNFEIYFGVENSEADDGTVYMDPCRANRNFFIDMR